MPALRREGRSWNTDLLVLCHARLILQAIDGVIAKQELNPTMQNMLERAMKSLLSIAVEDATV